MTKGRFLQLLQACEFANYPILELVSRSHYEDIVLKANGVGSWLIHLFDMRKGGANARLTEHWRRYNHWLDRWYAGNGPLPHLSGYNEHKASLRASGMDDKRIDELIKGDKMADGNLRINAIKLLVKILEELPTQNEEPLDMQVDKVISIIENALHDAHAEGVEAGREGT